MSLGLIRLEGLRMARRIDRNPSQKASPNSVLPPMALFDFWRQFYPFEAFIHLTVLPDNRDRVDATAAQSSHSTLRPLTAAIGMLTIRHNPVATPDQTQLFAEAIGDGDRCPVDQGGVRHGVSGHGKSPKQTSSPGLSRVQRAWSDLRVR
jgi:hypothetical protein